MFKNRTRRAKLTGWPALALLLCALAAAGYLCSRSFTDPAQTNIIPTVAPTAAPLIPIESKVNLTCLQNCNTDTPIILRTEYGARAPILKQYPNNTQATILEQRPGKENENAAIMYYKIKIDSDIGWIENYSVKIDIFR